MLPLSDFSRGIAAATYAKNMPQAYFLNAAAPDPGLLSPRRESNQRDAQEGDTFDCVPLLRITPRTDIFKGASPPRQRGYPPAGLGAGCTTRSWVGVLYGRFDYHTVVCSRQTQFDSRPRGEWLFVEVGSRPLQVWGNGGLRPHTPPPRRRGAVQCRWCATRPQACWGVAPLARGPWAPLKSRFKEWGSRRGRGKPKYLSTFACFWLLFARAKSNPGRGAGSPTRFVKNNLLSPRKKREGYDSLLSKLSLILTPS